jgi:hypothetical protein
MMSKANLIRNGLFSNCPFAVGRRIWPVSIAVFVCVIIAPSLAYAHRGFGPAELGPPVITSGLLGFICYWLVMLWPSIKRKGAKGQNQVAPLTGGHVGSQDIRIKRKPRLRVIETGSQFHSDQNSSRRASNE